MLGIHIKGAKPKLSHTKDFCLYGGRQAYPAELALDI